MKISVVGSGGWGTALALLLLENGHEVTLWSYAEEESRILCETRENPMLKGVALPAGLGLTTDLSCVRGCKIVVLATPSFAVRSTAHRVAPLLDAETVLVSVSKGIEKETSGTLTQAIQAEVGAEHPVVALSGPSHAEEVGRGVPTAVVSASEDQGAAELVQDVFMSPRFRVYASDDTVGVELAAALLFYMDPGDLIPLAALAAGFHELGHWTAVRLMGGEVRVLRLTVTGGNMELDHRRPLTYGGELAAILAGPGVNLLLALLCARLGGEREALYALSGLSLALGWFNLLPIYPLDGGRALLLILSAFTTPGRARQAVWGCSVILVALLLAAGMSLLWRGGRNLTLPGMALWLLCGLTRREEGRTPVKK